MSSNQQVLLAGGGEESIALAHDTSPFISVYPWSVSGFGTKYANPATLPTGNGSGVSFGTT